MLKIGNKLRELRSKKSLSQEDIAHQLNMTQGNYCKLENDKLFPSGDTLEKIATFYDLPLQELFSNETQQIQYNKDSPHAINAFMIWQEPQKMIEDFLKSKDQIIALQAENIELLKKQIEDFKRAI